MARNGSGSMTIPNTLVAGTTITASDHNENYSDIATELTNSLALDGQSTMNGQFKSANGTAAAPGVAFGSDLDTGVYRRGANELGFSTGGTAAGYFDSSKKLWALGAFDAAGAANLQSTLGVTGDSTFTGAATFNGAATFSGAVTLPAATVTYAKIQNVAAVSLLGNPTGSAAAASEITVVSPLAFSGTTLLMGAGTLVGFSHAETAAHSEITGTIPYDNSVPLVSEGAELLTLSHTPKSATNLLLVVVRGTGAGSNTQQIVAIFDGSSCKAAETAFFTGTNTMQQVQAGAVYAAGSTSARNISVRIGSPGGNSFYVNGISTGRIFGGAAKWTLTVLEFKA